MLVAPSQMRNITGGSWSAFCLPSDIEVISWRKQELFLLFPVYFSSGPLGRGLTGMALTQKPSNGKQTREWSSIAGSVLTDRQVKPYNATATA